jgi:pimeloyl-ACP methyl ester carboxylesterase
MKVLLVHGLGRSSLSMVLLGKRLARSGYDPEFFGYSALTETQPRIVARLTRRLRILAQHDGEIGLIGHSFGGLLLREACARVPELRVRHLVMLGTPNQPPRLAARVYKWLPFRVLRGSCGQCLADPSWYTRLPAPTSPYTVVAGTTGWRGRLSPFRGERNDGVVAVSETPVRPGDVPIEMPLVHTLMMNSKAVYRLIERTFAGVRRNK